jgi:hypothetical protein
MNRSGLLVGVVFLSACAYGAPLGFSGGDSWSIQLVGPLEDNELVVPVKINGKGPYLFVIDTDAEHSSVDSAISSELELYCGLGEEKPDERDKKVRTTNCEIPKLQVGDQLTVSSMKAVNVHKFGTYWVGGRQMRGVLGRDVVADSLMLGVDRDRGLVTLATQGHLAAPAGARELGWKDHRYQAEAPRRRLVGAQINGQNVTMHVDLGATFSQLWAKKMDQLKLPRLAVRATVVDEVATARQVSFAAMAAKVSAGGVDANGIMMLPYEDKRTRDIDLDGSLGLNFFAGQNLVVNLHKKKLYMTPRAADAGADAADRLGRWGNAFGRCKNPACVVVRLQADGGNAGEPAPPPEGGAPAEDRLMPPPPPASYTLFVTREPGAPAQAYDVLIEAVDAQGKTAGLPRLLVTLPKDQAEVLEMNFDPTYAGAAGFRVLDASPFPRECKGPQCVFRMRM